MSYHYRVMRDAGWLVLVETIPRREALEHRYRLTSKANRSIDRLL